MTGDGGSEGGRPRPAYAAPECAPFFMDSGGGECCLCVHGFTGCPAIFLPLGETLRALGFSVSAPLLAGHGTRPEDLAGIQCDAWFEGPAAELEALLGRFGRVHIIGLSLGGAIASWLAARYAGNQRLGKLVLLSPGFALADKALYTMDYESAGDGLMPLPRRPLLGDGLDAARFGYAAAPVRSIGRLAAASERGRASLPGVRAPTMLLYTAADRVADPVACESAVGAIESLSRSHRYEGGEHNLLLGPDRLDVTQRVMAFLVAGG